jgi:hypothetical protein
MNGFEVTVEVLRDVGRSGSSVAGEVAVLLPLAQAAGEIVDALPGGAAAAAAAALGAAWRARVVATAEALAQQAAALLVAADAYGAAERAAVTALAGEPGRRVAQATAPAGEP